MSLNTDPGQPGRSGKKGDDSALDPPDAGLAGALAPPVKSRSALADPVAETDSGVITARPLALQRALREVEASIDAEQVSLLERLDTLTTRDEELQAKLEELYLELGNVSAELNENAKKLRDFLGERSSLRERRGEAQATAMQRTLLTSAAELRGRDAAWKEHINTREARRRAFTADPELATQIAEFRRLDERIETLHLLPESYREVVRKHHAELKEQLQPHLDAPEELEMEALPLAVAVAISGGRDPSGAREDSPARLLALVPLDYPTFKRAKGVRGSLPGLFAARIGAILSSFTNAVGSEAKAKVSDLDGLVGIELDLGDLMLPMAPMDLARALRDSFVDDRDQGELASVGVFAEMVVVASRGVERLWERAEREKVTRAKTNSAKGKGARTTK